MNPGLLPVVEEVVLKKFRSDLLSLLVEEVDVVSSCGILDLLVRFLQLIL